jgi:hypothetical protein
MTSSKARTSVLVMSDKRRPRQTGSTSTRRKRKPPSGLICARRFEQAEQKLTRMQEAIEKSAHVEDAVAELAADALRRGTNVSERSGAWQRRKSATS